MKEDIICSISRAFSSKLTNSCSEKNDKFFLQLQVEFAIHRVSLLQFVENAKIPCAISSMTFLNVTWNEN